MHRPTVGVIAAVLLLVGAIGQVGHFSEGTQNVTVAFLRVGTVLAVVWLALPQTRKLKSKFWMAAIVAVAGALVWRRQLIPFLLAFIFIVAILRPRIQKKPPRPKQPSREKDR
jgi:hypothetical protein